MGLFSLFGKQERSSEEASKEINWIPLVSSEQLADIIAQSAQKPQLIFKNSITCGISSMVLRSFEANYVLNKEQADLYFLNIQHNRDLSGEIAAQFGVRHESPQVLIIKNGSVVKDASHGAIAHLAIEKYL